MAHLQDFQADLAFERSSSSDGHGSPSMNSGVTSKVASRSNSPHNLGQVYLVLFQASRSALRKAIDNIDCEGSLSSALRDLITYVDTPENLQNHSIELAQMQDVLKPLTSKVMKKADDPGKKTAMLLLDWLLTDYPHRELAAKCLSLDLLPANEKKTKLAALVILEHVLQQLSKPHAKVKKQQPDNDRSPAVQDPGVTVDDADSKETRCFKPEQLIEWISLLETVVKDDGSASIGSAGSMTRLTGLALDVSITMSQILAKQATTKIKEMEAESKSFLVVKLDAANKDDAWFKDPDSPCLCFARSMQSMQRIIKRVQSWEQWRHGLLSAGLTDVMTMIVIFNRSQLGAKDAKGKEIIRIFAQSWTLVSSALPTISESMSIPSLIDTVQKQLKAGDIPPSLRLLTAGLFLGHVESNFLTERILPSSEALRSTIFTLSTVVTAEDNPVGRNVAVLIQQLVSSTMDEADFAKISPQIVSLLDRETEISLTSARVVAQHAILFPQVVMPEILKPLRQHLNSQPSRVTDFKARNALGVVEALSDMNYFTKTLPSKEESLRASLEETVISLLPDEDIKIKLTASQMVASFDPSSIVERFAPQLGSPESEVRSAAEIVLIECMLSQRKDGSIGDGFDSFIEYARHVARIGPDPSISSSKVKNPAQLVSKAAGVKKNVLREENREQSLDILFRFLRKFSEAIPSFQWCHFLNSLVQKTYGAPSDQILVRVWNSLAVSISDCPEAIIALSQRITIILEQQGVLTESMLEEALEASDEALDDLRLSRLSPLLILKTIPAQGFVRVFRSLESESGPLDVKAVPSQLSKVLETRTDNELEFSLVRKLALAIKHGIYPDSSLETIYGQLKKCFPTKADNDTVGSPTSIELEEGRAWLFAFYNWVLNWSIQSNSQEQNENDIQWIYRIVSEVFFKIITLTSSSASEGDNENGLYKMQLGVLDVLSKLIIATTPFYTRRPTGPFWSKLKKLSRDVVPDSNNATIEELVEDEGDEMQAESLSIPKSAEDLLLALLADVLGGATAPISHNDSCDSNISRAICFANVLIMAMQSLAPMKQQSHAGGKHPASPGAMVSMAQEDKDTDYPPSAQWIPCALMDLITPALGSALTTYLQENAEEALEATGNTDPTLSLVQACIQVLYTGTSVASAVERRTTSRNTNLWLIETAVVGLENRSFTIAVSALKLLAAIAASKSLTADMLTEHRLIAIRRGLTRLHQSKELKTGNGMAPEISVLVDKMWELVG